MSFQVSEGKMSVETFLVTFRWSSNEWESQHSLIMRSREENPSVLNSFGLLEDPRSQLSYSRETMLLRVGVLTNWWKL
ncbi:hypothetical protein CARUB_v10028676mg [Capsella rubella]|uniref:Uncharacterized protein n=1 Tax=Capsella rubella TaxID=81985 RepID=R0F1V0_9BRAS|nr:hypothetical protein CARUB_v10028676mg [Capsella rubella]